MAEDNASHLSACLGFTVSPRLPFVLLQAARSVVDSMADRSRLGVRICQRADHYCNVARVLATAILHYDLAANLVAVRDSAGVLKRCENSLFAQLLNMPPRTVDNAIYSLKRSGLYLSVEQRTVSREQPAAVRGSASIKRLNMYLFDLLGLGRWASVQRNKARQRVEHKRLSSRQGSPSLESYRRTDDSLRAKRNRQREQARLRRLSEHSSERPVEHFGNKINSAGRLSLTAIRALLNLPLPDTPD
ncbi:hypothetical protein [Veronia pacifica]